jgi:hypothetical protein
MSEDMRGKASTFGTLLIWDEQEFVYQRVIDFTRHRDARGEVLALHNPPMVLVESVRVGTELLRP